LLLAEFPLLTPPNALWLEELEGADRFTDELLAVGRVVGAVVIGRAAGVEGVEGRAAGVEAAGRFAVAVVLGRAAGVVVVGRAAGAAAGRVEAEFPELQPRAWAVEAELGAPDLLSRL
jgi:hypothetical protein